MCRWPLFYPPPTWIELVYWFKIPWKKQTTKTEKFEITCKSIKSLRSLSHTDFYISKGSKIPYTPSPFPMCLCVLHPRLCVTAGQVETRKTHLPPLQAEVFAKRNLKGGGGSILECKLGFWECVRRPQQASPGTADEHFSEKSSAEWRFASTEEGWRSKCSEEKKKNNGGRS